VENTVLVQVDQCLQNLISETLSLLTGQGLIATRAHVLLQVELNVLEYKVELFLGVDDFFEPKKQKDKIKFK